MEYVYHMRNPKQALLFLQDVDEESVEELRTHPKQAFFRSGYFAEILAALDRTGGTQREPGRRRFGDGAQFNIAGPPRLGRM